MFIPGVQKPHCNPCSFQKLPARMKGPVGCQSFTGQQSGQGGLHSEHGAGISQPSRQLATVHAPHIDVSHRVRTIERDDFAEIVYEEEPRLHVVRVTVSR